MRRMYDKDEIKEIANTIIDDTQAAIDSTYSSSKITMELDEKENKLISGINIKTINGTSILGSGNVEILGSGNVEAGGGKLYVHYIGTYAPTTEMAFIINALSTKSSQYLDFNEMYNDNFFPGQVKVESQGTVYNTGYFTKGTVGNEKVLRFDTATDSLVTKASEVTVLTDEVTEL